MAADEPLPAIAEFLRRGQDDPASFDALARRLFARQYARIAPYRAFCDSRGVTPETLCAWSQIPAAPAAAFKRFALTCAPESDCTPARGGRVFHSSGTTAAQTSRHFLDAAALDLYGLSLTLGFERAVRSAPREILALMPPPARAPHSSLSFMLGELVASREGRFFHEEGWIESLARTLRAAPRPFLLFGTAFAFVHFFDATGDERFALPAGSVLIETGGFKGRSREIPRAVLYALFTQKLGVLPERCLAEYGMSEMASQFYDRLPPEERDGGRVKAGPHWVRTRALDPATGDCCAPGTPGLLVHYDLANANSVLAIQTEDWGYTVEEGGFVLIGRAPGAALRGCSLTAVE